MPALKDYHDTKTTVTLDLGPHVTVNDDGTIEVPPGIIRSLLHDQEVRDALRTEAARASKAAQRLALQNNGHSTA
jgi:hypothetical protein